jgi:hypothetical protein
VSERPIGRADEQTAAAASKVDLAARLAAAATANVGVEVAIRPPLPEPPVVPADQIPVDPGSGLVIRKRTTSTAPPPDTLPLPPDVGFTVRTRVPSGSVKPDPLQARVKYVVRAAVLTGDGIQAMRFDGLDARVGWPDIVGVVARRLPAHAPFDSAHFVDVVSTRGATLRFLATTRIDGHTFVDDPIERARAFVNIVAAQALEAKLDSATKAFARGDGKAAQLRDETMLAAHDERLA